MDLDQLRAGPLRDIVDPAPIVERETVFAGRVWDIVRDTVTFGGSTMAREYVAHSGAVAVIALDDDDNVLLINQYRQPIGVRGWEIPAGLLDVPGEAPLAAAQRELAEETDLVASEWTALVSPYPSPGGLNEVVHIFQARQLSASSKRHERTDEEAEIVVRWVPISEVISGVIEGRLRNGPLMMAVLVVAAHRARGVPS
jgi:ADP-ribose pyrophosphatase